MIIPKSIEYEIEMHFIMHKEEKQQIQQLQTDIAEAITPNLDGVGGGGGLSDPTAQKAAQIERETKSLRLWVQVVEKTFARYKGTLEGEYIKHAYVNGSSHWIELQELMNVGQATVYRKRQEVLTYAAIKASEVGLIVF